MDAGIICLGFALLGPRWKISVITRTNQATPCPAKGSIGLIVRPAGVPYIVGEETMVICHSDFYKITRGGELGVDDITRLDL